MDQGFLREALIYLVAAVIAAPLFHRLKLGSVSATWPPAS
jgi:Kef-type K+ transport system membrane component KefB